MYTDLTKTVLRHVADWFTGAIYQCGKDAVIWFMDDLLSVEQIISLSRIVEDLGLNPVLYCIPCAYHDELANTFSFIPVFKSYTSIIKLYQKHPQNTYFETPKHGQGAIAYQYSYPEILEVEKTDLGYRHKIQVGKHGIFDHFLDCYFWVDIFPIASVHDRSKMLLLPKDGNTLDFVLDREIKLTGKEALLFQGGYLYAASFKQMWNNIRIKSLKRVPDIESRSIYRETEEDKKALKSLRDEISEKDYRSFLKHHRLYIRSPLGRKFSIRHNSVRVFDLDKKLKSICIHTDTKISLDHILNLKHLIDIDEDLVITGGNVRETLQVDDINNIPRFRTLRDFKVLPLPPTKRYQVLKDYFEKKFVDTDFKSQVVLKEAMSKRLFV